MINQSLDFYDDLEGTTLKGRISDFNRLPDFIKSAEQLSSDIRNQLPDDVYALVLLDGGRKMRKYACTDKGNTALSVIYFMENRHKLPEEAQKIAAQNLLTACGWYDMEPPAQLEKVALVGAAMNVLSAVDAAKTGKSNMQKMKARLGESGAPQTQEPMKVSELSGSDVMPYSPESTKKASMTSREVGIEPDWSDIGDKKTARTRELTPTEKDLWPHDIEDVDVKRPLVGRLLGMGKTVKQPRTKPIDEKEYREYLASGKHPEDYFHHKSKEKLASLHPHVDVTGLCPPPRVEHKQAGQFFCLIKEGGARYPIDTAREVEKAAEYFTNYSNRFTPFERHRYCTNLVKRAEDLGMKMPDLIRKYGSSSYDPNVKLAVVQRRRFFHEGTSEYGLVNELMDKCAAIVPETFAVMLEQFDRRTGLSDRWGNGISDPYFSVFGFEKQANWSFTYSNDHINEDQLKKLSTDVIRREELKRRFGCDMVEEFEKEPTQIFDSLPLEHKRIIMHMAAGVEE